MSRYGSRSARPTCSAPGTSRACRGSTSPGFDGVLSVDPEARTADVLGMTTYEHLVDATLPLRADAARGPAAQDHHPRRRGHRARHRVDVVPQRAARTSRSSRSTSSPATGGSSPASPTDEHADLFRGFPNSYGTLGYALRLRIELEPVQPYVTLDPSTGSRDAVGLRRGGRDRRAPTGRYDGDGVDFLDGTVFAPDECYLTVGTWATRRRTSRDYTGNAASTTARSSQRAVDYLTVRDYLWRWDTDWFWCSRAMCVQKPWVRPLCRKRFLRSDVYWKVVGFERRHRGRRGSTSGAGTPAQEHVIQDVEVPVDRAAGVPRLLPPRGRDQPGLDLPAAAARPASRRGTCTRSTRETTYVNVGFWSAVDLPAGETDGYHNRRIEQKVAELGGHKSLYSTAFYPDEEFWATYNGASYDVLKKAYDPDGRLLDLYAKTVQDGGRPADGVWQRSSSGSLGGAERLGGRSRRTTARVAGPPTPR